MGELDRRGIFSLKFGAIVLLAAGGWAVLDHWRFTEATTGSRVKPLETAGPILLRFDPGTMASPQDLVRFPSATAGARGERLFAERERGGAVALGYSMSGADSAIVSPALPAQAGPIELLVSASALYPSAGFDTWKSWLLVRANGAPFWEVPVDAQAAPRRDPEVVDGVAIEMPPGRSAAATPPLTRAGIRGARLRLRVSPGMVGRSFPLVEIGHRGRSDLLFVRVTPGPRLVFGFSHGGDVSIYSRPSDVRLEQDLEVELLVPDLAANDDPQFLSVALDGRPVWKSSVRHFPPQPAEVYFGANPLALPAAEAAITGARFEGVTRPVWTAQ